MDEGEPRFRAFQGLDRSREKAAFEQFIDFVCARLERWPDLHVYHYAAYEPSALKRLMPFIAVQSIDPFRIHRPSWDVLGSEFESHSLRHCLLTWQIHLNATASAESASAIDRLPLKRGVQCSAILSRQPTPHMVV